MTIDNRFAQITRDPNLSPKQKSNFLALEAEASLPYMAISDAVIEAKESGIICDMFEGNAPFKPRYVLPDYAKFLQNGSEYLELSPAQDLDEALNALTIIYHHVPSVTNIPVYLGQLDDILLPFCQGLEPETIYRKLKLFWIMLDRTLPDAFMHVNIGPTDNIVCRTILRVDAELKQIAPNLTFMYDPQITPDELLQVAASNICECSKPHIANYPLHANSFDEKGFGIVSCYNSLPLAGGANTLVRINLKEVALKACGVDDFFNQVLPHYCQLTYELIEARAKFLHEESNFFNSFLVKEGLIEESRFAPMFGIYGMAEAVNILQGTPSNDYGHNSAANELGHKISKALDAIVKSTQVKYGYNGLALLHSQGGISIDRDVTPGVRIPYGTEPNPIAHIQALAEHHQYYTSGISDILTIDETIKANPEAMMQLCKGALSLGFREFTANVASNDLVRVTGYMVKLSDIASFKAQGSRTNTTWLGAEAAQNTKILERQPRVVANEHAPVYAK
ncbi:YjjI family glycine radical enzyme [Shewanella schlegeliana]|uniref:YjjI family glycine radical enzyme n=1 Tax=Shewanella schlegeliana TaxID=190308 RepID=A0ABS1T1V9_9GAMM|nr:YjjI family glycine radical enzyme [Shewanella schlegeliana]MBL4914575.1 YjjI family glycine radical enzyme [Shewanella schlegeliana]MCL1109609.1 YjjI family glycine radical enzyme [Shewanella schlegeliana]GIU29904.1 glycine radical enzyme, YjjI family protein [Shewanella schlegeliana]